MNDRWLSVGEIATHLGVSKDTVYSWISEKKLPAHKIGRLWKFKTLEIDRWVRTGKAAGIGKQDNRVSVRTKKGQ